MPQDRRADVAGAVVAAILMAAAAAALWVARNYTQFGSLFPRVIGGVMLVFAALALARSLRGTGPRRRGIVGEGLARSVLLVLVMAAWIALLEPAGFVASSIGAFVLLALVANRDPLTPLRVATIVVLSAVVVVAFDRLFVDVLNVQLPRGAFGG